jgi:hypothetical protein
LTDFIKHTSLLQYSINDYLKKFYIASFENIKYMI